MLISPLVPKGSIFQHPQCSAKFKAANGSCTGSASKGSDSGGAQFEHSSLPATIKNLFGLSDFLTERDAWAGDLSELLSMATPRADTPLHLPPAHPPQTPWVPAGGMPPEPPPPPPPIGPPWCANATSSGLPCTLFAAGKMCQDQDMIGSGGAARGTIASCLQWCTATPNCKVFSITGKCDHGSCGWCVRYSGCTPRSTNDPEYDTFERTNAATSAGVRRLAADEAAPGPRHCSAKGGSSGDCAAPATADSKQMNRMRTLGALTGAPLPEGTPSSADANAWTAARWAEYMRGAGGR